MANTPPQAGKNSASPLKISGTTTPEQSEMIQKFLEDTAREVASIAVQHLDEVSAQSLMEMREQVKSELVSSLVDIVNRNAVSELYADEEAPSRREYPPAYKLRPLEAQVTTLRTHFPQLSTCNEKMARRSLPEGAEGWFAVPHWEKLGATYTEAVEAVLAALRKQRQFHNRIPNKLDGNFLRQMERSERAWSILREQQPDSDILVVAAQMGMLHRGRSARRTRVVMASNEFGLGAFAMGCMLLTHPERLSNIEALMIDCCGDEYAFLGNGHFDRVPLYDYDLGGVQFSIFYHDRARYLWGSPTAFLFQM